MSAIEKPVLTPPVTTPAPVHAAQQEHALAPPTRPKWQTRSEEHTSELQSRRDLVCRLLLEKKKTLATLYSFILTLRTPPSPPLFPYTTLFRSQLPLAQSQD